MKPGGPAKPLKAVMVFLIHLYIYSYAFTYLGTLIYEPVLNIKLAVLPFIQIVSAYNFDLLEYLCRAEGVLDPRLPPDSCCP